MKLEKLAHKLESIQEKIENMNHEFKDDQRQIDYDSLKMDIAGNLEEMQEIIHAEVERESDEHEEPNED